MLTIHHLTIDRTKERLIGPLNLSIAAGEVFTLMGRSGTGKSTVLNWLIGALPPVFTAAGEIQLNQQRIDQLPTQQRRIGILFQDDLLFPHMTVGDNLAFALPHRITGRSQRRDHINEVLKKAELNGFYERDPASLSGGQRARVSVLRALLAEPAAILLDEPFSRLDSELRNQFRAFVYQQISDMNIPALLVTHDHEDIPDNGKVINTGDKHHV